MTVDLRAAATDSALLTMVAEANGVCIRPILHQVLDTHTGETRTVAIPCGATKASKCAPCADKARRLRMQQCREGWHRIDEPEHHDDDTEQPDERDVGAEGEAHGDGPSRRVRSTRRRSDAPDLPRVEMSERTIGRVMTSPSGKTYRPSMFLTFTLPSYGPVHRDGTPVSPATYDYRRAALDAMHFSRLVDRLWQNLRRCAGYRVQYFSVVEEQHRLAPHLHAAVRGVIPRGLVVKVVAATYHQVWWPDFDEAVYADDQLPAWDPVREAFCCPHSGQPLSAWERAMDELDANPASRPAHVVRFGKQSDYKWLIAGSPRTDKTLGYITKYLTKSIANTYDPDHVSTRQADHVERLMAHVKVLPCGPECGNWLRYGIQPKGSDEHTIPGGCRRAAHDPENLGYGGRRVLVSRDWTSKTLTDHKADRAAIVREVLAQAGIEVDDTDHCSACVVDRDGRQRFEWHPIDPADLTSGMRRAAILVSIQERQRRRSQYERAQRAGPPRPPASQPNPRSPRWPSRASEASHVVTRSALDGQRGDRTINQREAAGHLRTGRNHE
ncbi:replication initiator [Nocardioides terrisoli]|uniref:replication initiator n=1 Tax=Nocardioides terrisoli TaxID=3388267 RepID=UPI00287B7B26|nr:replication initiator [Nocardioides marmorisolisilvae]